MVSLEKGNNDWVLFEHPIKLFWIKNLCLPVVGPRSTNGMQLSCYYVALSGFCQAAFQNLLEYLCVHLWLEYFAQKCRPRNAKMVRAVLTMEISLIKYSAVRRVCAKDNFIVAIITITQNGRVLCILTSFNGNYFTMESSGFSIYISIDLFIRKGFTHIARLQKVSGCFNLFSRTNRAIMTKLSYRNI